MAYVTLIINIMIIRWLTHWFLKRLIEVELHCWISYDLYLKSTHHMYLLYVVYRWISVIFLNMCITWFESWSLKKNTSIFSSYLDYMASIHEKYTLHPKHPLPALLWIIVLASILSLSFGVTSMRSGHTIRLPYDTIAMACEAMLENVLLSQEPPMYWWQNHKNTEYR